MEPSEKNEPKKPELKKNAAATLKSKPASRSMPETRSASDDDRRYPHTHGGSWHSDYYQP